jgi:hypothetical protein
MTPDVTILGLHGGDVEVRNKFISIKRLNYNLPAIICIIVLLAVVLPAGQPPVLAGEEDKFKLDLSDLPPKGNPKLDSALNRMVAEQSPSVDGPLMSRRSLQAEETVRVIVQAVPGQSPAP